MKIRKYLHLPLIMIGIAMLLIITFNVLISFTDIMDILNQSGAYPKEPLTSESKITFAIWSLIVMPLGFANMIRVFIKKTPEENKDDTMGIMSISRR